MRRSASVLLSLLVAAALCVPASAAIETVTAPASPGGPINPGWNLISVPAIPTNPGLEAVFDEYPIAMANGDILRYDAPNQGMIAYDPFSGPESFGNVLLTDGYWLKLGPEGVNQLSFEAITDNDNTDMWISLPRRGWAIIGCPFSYEVDWNTVEVTDGTVTVPILTARDNLWLDSVCLWWDSNTRSLCQMGIEEDFVESSTFKPWHGYWIRSKRDNLALIVPAVTN